MYVPSLNMCRGNQLLIIPHQSYTDGKLKVFVYHNSNPKVKNVTVKELKAFDVIMISCMNITPFHRLATSCCSLC